MCINKETTPTRYKMSLSPEATTLIEVIKVLNLGALIPSALTLSLVWKLYGYFNELSEKLTRIETKIDSVKEILPYKIKECVEKMGHAKKEEKQVKHNPSIEWIDLVEIIGTAFGIVDIVAFFALLFSIEGLANLWFVGILLLAFIVPSIFGLMPLFFSRKKKHRAIRAFLSLISLIPWLYLLLLVYGIV
jgi:hypothetical protein